eukprot:6181915-Pleurochrysis_carterae.AAC.1
MPLPGDALPGLCIAPGCIYGHTKSQTAEGLSTMLQTEAELKADQSKAGKGRFSRWQMAHAATHGNVQPATYGQPMHDPDMDQHILDSLHLAKLGLPKTPWKFGIMNDFFNEARASASSLQGGHIHSTAGARTITASVRKVGHHWKALEHILRGRARQSRKAHRDCDTRHDHRKGLVSARCGCWCW